MRDVVSGVSLGLKGRVSVDLMDAGRVVASQRTENLVSPRLLANLENYAHSLLVPREYSSSTTSYDGVSVRNTAGTVFPAFTSSPFGGILLTDYTGTPSETDVVPQGTIVGMSSLRAGTQEGTLRGVQNLPESEMRSGYMKLVYDFDTSRANGTFQSIYLGPFDTFVDTSFPTFRPPVYSSVADGDYLKRRGYTLHAGSGTVFTKLHNSASATIYKSDLTAFIDSIRNGGSGVWTAVTLPSAAYAIAVRGERLYWYGPVSGSGSGRTCTVYSAPVTNLASATTEAVLDATVWDAVGLSSGVFNGFSWSPTRDAWLFSSTSASAGDIFEFDSAFALVRGFTKSDAVDAYSVSAIPGSSDFITSGSRVYRLINASSSAQLVGNLWAGVRYQNYMSGESSYGLLAHTSVLSENLIVTANGSTSTNDEDGNNLAVAALPLHATHALLANPVTKTSATTMKVTYELTFPTPSYA